MKRRQPGQPLTDAEIVRAVRSIVEWHSRVSPVGDHDSWKDNLGISMADYLEIIWEIQRHFRIFLGDEDAEGIVLDVVNQTTMDSVISAATLVKRLVLEANSPTAP